MDSVSSSKEASTALPYPHLERASAGLQGEMRHRLPTDVVADWTTLEIPGPTETADGVGRTLRVPGDRAGAADRQQAAVPAPEQGADVGAPWASRGEDVRLRR